MKRTLMFGSLLAAALVLPALAAPSALAQGNSPYALSRPVAVAAGGEIGGGAYRLANNVAQPEPGPAQGGGGYTLTGGLVNAGSSGAIVAPDRTLYLPHVLR